MNIKHLFAFLLLSIAPLHAADISKYNVMWDSPSKDSLDSMPLSGRLGAGANVWVEAGSIWIYPSHNGAYDEVGRLLKLGCIRVTPVDFKLGEAGFRQELVLANGSIKIEQGDFKASLWFAGETLVLESSSGKPLAYDVAYGTWRDRKRDGILVDVFSGPRQSFTQDQVHPSKEGFVWFHRNADYPVDLAEKAKKQGISPELVRDLTTARENLASQSASAASWMPIRSNGRPKPRLSSTPPRSKLPKRMRRNAGMSSGRVRILRSILLPTLGTKDG